MTRETECRRDLADQDQSKLHHPFVEVVSNDVIGHRQPIRDWLVARAVAGGQPAHGDVAKRCRQRAILDRFEFEALRGIAHIGAMRLQGAGLVSPASHGKHDLIAAFSIVSHAGNWPAAPGEGRKLCTRAALGANMALAGALIARLDATVETVIFDVPGAGQSPAPKRPYRMFGLARLVLSLLDRLAYGEVDVMGVSWGGVLAQQFAIQ
jgi:hypothetical protein